MPSVFKIYVGDIATENLVWSSDQVTGLNIYGDAILSPKLKKETNKADSFEFMILPNSDYYDSFEKKKTFVYLTRDENCIFYGRVSDIKTDIFKQRTITCEGALGFLADSVQPPNKDTKTENAGNTKKERRNVVYISASGSQSSSRDAIKMSVANYFTSVISTHNAQVSDSGKGFTVGSITVNDANDVETFERTSFQDTSSVISSDLLSVYGGVLRIRYENHKAYIDWLDEYTVTSNQEIRFGVNMVDLDQEPPTDDVWSVLLASGEENITIASANGGDKYLVDSDAVEKYGYIVHHHQFNNAKTASKLLKKARRYLRTHGKVFPDNIVVKAIDLQLLGESDDPLELGEKIKVISTPHGINKTMACIAMELDIFNPENNSYTIGTIMPPDKEKKKDSLSSKQAADHSNHSRGIGNNANALAGAQEDINVNANNINVNAENIAVNARNIAVNAENIAVVAKNIAIAADTIDIKAQQITATLEDVENNLSAKITLTASNLMVEFNKKLYGENQDGTGGLYADYSSKIEASATSIRTEVTQKLYGTGGTQANPKDGSIVADYRSTINQTAQNIRTEVHTTIYGDGGTQENPKAGSIVADYRSSISQTASQINSTVSQKVGKTEIASTINQTAQTVLIQANKINLSGYVTAEALSATNANLENLITGTDVATKIVATDAKVASGTLEIGDSSNKAKLKYRGTEYYSLTVSMPGVTGSFNALGLYYLDSAYRSSISLAHSHSVTTNTDGTITIGGSVATDAPASQRSFKIADTKTYKDGVSAAIASVTVDSIARAKGSDGNYIEPTYSSSAQTLTASIKATASNSNSKTSTVTIPAGKAYNDGYGDVTVSSIARAKGSDGNFVEPTYSKYTLTASITATASNTKTLTSTVSIPAGKAYNDGHSDGYDDGYSDGRSSVSAEGARIRATSDAVADDDSKKDCANIYLTISASNGDTKNVTLYKVPMWMVYNEGYDEGYDKGVDQVLSNQYVDSVTVHSNGSATVKVYEWHNGAWHSHSYSVQASRVTDNHS